MIFGDYGNQDDEYLVDGAILTCDRAFNASQIIMGYEMATVKAHEKIDG